MTQRSARKIRKARQAALAEVLEALQVIQDKGGCIHTLPRAQAALEKVQPYLLGPEYSILKYMLDATQTSHRFGRPEDFDEYVGSVRTKVIQRLSL